MSTQHRFRLGWEGCALAALWWVPAVVGATPWSTETHTLAVGDFNGDGKDDLLYIAHDIGGASGIALSDGVSPTLNHQSWASNYLGIPWYDKRYLPIVADFNGDGRSDVLLQAATPANSFLIVTDSTGRLSAIRQTIGYTHLGLNWAASDHRIVAGDFNGDGKADLFLQGARREVLNAVVLADAAGQFSAGPQQTWGDSYLGFRWTVPSALVYAGDFNGDGKADLLVQAKPDIVLIDYDIPVPVPIYRPQSFGIVPARALSGGQLFYSPVLQMWDRNHLGAEWSASLSHAVIGDFNGDGRDDIFLQPISTPRPASLLLANTSGQFQTSNALLDANINTWTSAQYRLHAANFDGAGGAGLYLQATSAGGTNAVAANISSATVSTTQHDPNLLNNVTPGTAVGAITGEFSVDPSGGASYRIPIALPPGVAGLAPELTLAYSSRGTNGLMGVGWTVMGLSSISRCPYTWATDGITDGVDFDSNDAFCLDGQRLKVIGGAANGAVGAEYRTELESFQRVLSAGGVAGDPGSWTVWDKAGLIREYGTTDADTASGDDTHIEASKPGLAAGTGPTLIWAVKRIRDRFDNFIEFKYEQDLANSSFWPTEITYGSKYNGAKTVVGRVVFTYFAQPRADQTSGYIAGGYLVGLKKLLQKVTVYGRADPTVGGVSAASAKVREYYLNYEQSTTSGLSHLISVVLCDGASPAAQSCAKETQFQWQYGYRGFGQEFSSLVRLNESDHLKTLDIDADGRVDYVYQKRSGMFPSGWAYRLSSLRSSEVATSWMPQSPTYAVTMDYDSDGYQDIVERTGSPGNYQVIRGGPSGLQAVLSTSVAALALSHNSEATVVGDFNGDGRQDLGYLAQGTTDAAKVWGSVVAVQLNSASGLTQPMAVALQPDNRPGSPHDVKGRTEEGAALRVINFDNDGRDDLLVLVDDCATTYEGGPVPGDPDPQPQVSCLRQARVVSMNDQGALVQRWPQAGATFWGWQWSKLKLLDANGDGLTDILHYAGPGTGWQLLLGTGDPATTWQPTSAWSATSISVSSCIEDWTGFDRRDFPSDCTGQTYALTESKLDDAVAYDYNRDGLTDVLFPENGYWFVLPSSGSGFQNVVWATSRFAIRPDATFVIDDRADGVMDLMFPSGSDPDSFWHLYHGRGPISGMIEKITDGLGAETTIQYAPLTALDPTTSAKVVYKGHQPMIEGGEPAFPYAHFAAPIPVVYQFAADNGRTNSDGSRGAVHTAYEYYGLKIHRQGRGVLGFSEVRSWNNNTDIQTLNRHVQTFPYTGMVLVSRQLFKGQATYQSQLSGDGVPGLLFDYDQGCETNALCLNINPVVIAYTGGGPVSETTNVAHTRDFPDGNRYFPYVRSSTAKVFALTTAGAGAIHKQTRTEHLSASGSATEPAYDEYGNPHQIRVTTNTGTSGADEHIVTTSNTYAAADTSNWCLGRLTRTTVRHQSPAHAGNYQGATGLTTDITREATFTYQPGFQCLLQAENTEPSADGGSWRLTKTYTYDTYGNRVAETVGGHNVAAGQERTTSSNYTATQGQFPTVATNALGHSEYSVWDGRFGVQTQLTGPNGLTAQFEYDTYGRKIKETPISTLPAISSEQRFYWCANTGVCTDSRGVFALRTTASDGGESWSEFDRLGRQVRTRQLDFAGNWLHAEKHFDPLGREYLVSDPYTAGQNKCWTFRRFDALSRVVKEWTSHTEAACTATPPSYDQADTVFDSPAGAWQRTEYTHDLVSSNGLATKVVSNASDTTGYATARTGYKILDVMGHTRFVRDELSAGACPAGGGALSGSTAGCAQTEYDYDAQGNTTYVKQLDTTTGVLVETRISFNRRGLKTRMVDPDMGTWDYNYDVFGELTWQRDAKQQVTTLGYDKLGRMISRTEGAEGTTTWVYDTAAQGIGKLTRVTAPNGFEEHYFYDTHGRLQQTKRLMDGSWFWVDQTYDGQGRLDTLKYPNYAGGSTASNPGNDADRLRLRHSYNSHGYLASVSDAATATVYWTANEADQLGNIKKETLGNGLITQRAYDRVTGYLGELKTGTSGNPTSAQYFEFTFDAAANLRLRKDRSTFVNGGNGAREEFGYDKLHRLTATAYYSAHGASTPTSTESYAYNLFGNLTGKGGYGSYQYGARTACTNTAIGETQTVRPHAVYRVTVGTTRTFCHDANGNLVSATNSRYDRATWWVSNLARKISKGSQYSEFWYDPGRARYKQVAYPSATAQTTTHYVGSLYEKQVKVAGGTTTTEHVHYVRAGDRVVALRTRTQVGAGTPTLATYYLHRDHLGSVTAISDPTGAVTERFSFDPWGKRRHRDTWAAVAPGSYPTPTPQATQRGYTGHEQVDALGIIHMNGRIYDAEIGQFLSADPFVQFPESTQGQNRYSYVGNNPLSYTDPSGFFKLRDALKIAAVVVISIVTYGAVAAALTPGATFGGVLAGTTTLSAGTIAQAAFASGFVGGFLSSGGDFRAALLSGVGAVITAGIGSQFGSPSLFKNPALALAKAALHGLTQGVLQAVAGGRLGDGLLGGFFGSLAAPLATELANGARIGEFIATAVIGGTASVISGGQFANGAASAVFVKLFNDELHRATGRQADKLGRPLTVSEKEIYSKYFSDELLDSVRIYEGKVPWWLRRDMDGITLGNKIYFREGVYVAGTADGVQILGHELVHVRQYAEGMTIPKYLWASRRGYWRNPYEIDAYVKDGQIRRDFCSKNPQATGC